MCSSVKCKTLEQGGISECNGNVKTNLQVDFQEAQKCLQGHVDIVIAIFRKSKRFVNVNGGNAKIQHVAKKAKHIISLIFIYWKNASPKLQKK